MGWTSTDDCRAGASLLVGGVARARVQLVFFPKHTCFGSSSDNHESDVKNRVNKNVKQHKLRRKTYETLLYLKTDWYAVVYTIREVNEARRAHTCSRPCAFEEINEKK